MNDVKNCVVAVLVDGELNGTGYLANAGWVITCAHVLTENSDPPSSGIEIRFHCNNETFAVDVSKEWWSPPDHDDVAILMLKPGAALPACAEVAVLGRSPGRKDRECSVFGYPNVGDMNGLGGRAKVVEEVREFDGRGLLQLESTQATCGYSGAPLFDKSTGEVIGTVVEIVEQARARYARNLHGRLENLAFATPMEVIAKIVPGLSDEVEATEKVRQRVRSAVIQILTKHPGATKQLAARIDGLNEIAEHLLCPKVADYLLASSLDAFLPLVVSEFRSHRASSPEVAIVFREIATYVLPQVYKKSFLQEVRRRLNSDDNFLVIPASHKSIIELMIAGALGRQLEFEDNWKFEDGVPSGRLELQPNAELGIVQGKVEEKFIEGFERAIQMKIGGLGPMAEPKRALQRLLKRRRNQEPPIRFFYVYPRGQGRVEDLERQYSEVVFILPEWRHDDDEVDIVDELKQLFCPENHS